MPFLKEISRSKWEVRNGKVDIEMGSGKNLTSHIKNLIPSSTSFPSFTRPFGFTLIELLVAIGIVATITSFAAANFNAAQNSTRDGRRKEDLKALHTALISYFADHSLYPPKTDIGKAVSYASDASPDWIPDLTPTYIKKLPKDPKQAGLPVFLALEKLFREIPKIPQPVFAQTPQTATFSPSNYGNINRNGGSYPPGPPSAVSLNRLITLLNFNGSTYFLYNGMVGFDTSSLPDTATITGATLQSVVDIRRSDDNRNLTLEWYNNGWPIDESDWTETAGTSAHSGTPINSLGNSIALTDYQTNINKTGMTVLRTHISGGIPSAVNHTELIFLVLVVTYTTAPTPTPGPTPAPTPSPVPAGCAGKTAVYCYTASPDRLSFILWVQLDKNNDPQTFNGPQASCTTAPPPNTNFNYCQESPQ